MASRDALTSAECLAMRRTCICFNLRRAGRSVTQHFNAMLADAELTATQLALLAALNVEPSSTIADLADTIVVDPSTLSRTLSPLVRRGLVRQSAGRDRRTRIIALTARGRDTLSRAYPSWLAAQRALEGALEPAELTRALGILRTMGRRARALAIKSPDAPKTKSARPARRGHRYSTSRSSPRSR